MRQKRSVGAADYTFTVVFAPAEEGGYVATFPALPDLAAQGETLEEARAMALDCLRGYLEILKETGRPLPKSARMTAGAVRRCDRRLDLALPLWDATPW